MRVFTIIATVFTLGLLSGCIDQSTSGSPTKSAAEADFIPKVPGTDQYTKCLGPIGQLAWDGRGRQNNLIESLAKNVIDGATSPLISAAGNVALLPTHSLNATGPLVNAARGKGPDAAMPLCGKWCGPDYPTAADLPTNPIPTDPLDNACRTHDLCYAARGGYDCQCDKDLVQTVLRGRTILDITPIEQQIVALFRASPCFGGCKEFEGHRICGGRHIPMLGIPRQG